MGELEFQQRWGLRRTKDDDHGSPSTFDGSKSSSGQLPKKQNPVSNLISVDDDDEETNVSKVKDNGNIGKAKKCRTRNVGNKLQSSKMKRDCLEEVDLNKDVTTVDHVVAPLDQLKSLMESLLKDRKVTREDLLKWMLEEMQKLVADFTRPQPKRRKRGQRGDKVQLPQQMKQSNQVEDQHEKPRKESTRFRHPNGSEKRIQVQQRTDIREPVQTEGNITPSGGQVVPANSYHQTSSSDQNAKVLQTHKSVVLAIEAQKDNDESSKRTAKGKKTLDRNDPDQVPEDQCGYFPVMTTAVAGTNGEKFGSSVVRNFLPSLSGQTPLSSVPMEAIVVNRGLDASFCNYIPPSSNQGSLPVIHPDERTRNFAPMGSKNKGSFNLNSPSTSCIGTGFSVPFHQAMDVGPSITREPNPQYLSKDHSIKPPSSMMNGGGSYNLSQLMASNNQHHGFPSYKHDASFMSYLMQNIKDGNLFRQ